MPLVDLRIVKWRDPFLPIRIQEISPPLQHQLAFIDKPPYGYTLPALSYVPYGSSVVLPHPLTITLTQSMSYSHRAEAVTTNLNFSVIPHHP
jgi:hypothetical protein